MAATVKSNRSRRANAKRKHKQVKKHRRLTGKLGKRTGRRHSAWK